ncbi:MAG: DNA replication/repair protein RecF [Prolixibacteraceae bacterium]|jgi:DNA replication and repair protein RecF|nr:DNA replication/repair protein RecF [Prolixibacteraceae bacterium]
MYLQSLSVLDYKNVEMAEFDFSAKLNCFLGNNGAGKTNLLDAIYYLSFTKSFFNAVDVMNVRHGCQMFGIKGVYNSEGGESNQVSVGYRLNQKKQLKRNGKAYKRLSEHIGLYPLVMVSPSDTSLITGGSDDRRKFMDGVISQFDNRFLDALLRYNRLLMQRNNLLKQFAAENRFDQDTLSIYNEQLHQYGTHIFEKRRAFIAEIIPVFQTFYKHISGGSEMVQLDYQSTLFDGSLSEQLEDNQHKDRLIQFTSVGVHKDDLLLSLGDYPMKKVGSQGQTKTYLVALKLAQFEYLKKQSEIKPILLLDDVFDKLDANRVEKIIQLVSDDKFGQIFLTDTNREHLESIVEKVGSHYCIFRINNGEVEQ